MLTGTRDEMKTYHDELLSSCDTLQDGTCNCVIRILFVLLQPRILQDKIASGITGDTLEDHVRRLEVLLEKVSMKMKNVRKMYPKAPKAKAKGKA